MFSRKYSSPRVELHFKASIGSGTRWVHLYLSTGSNAWIASKDLFEKRKELYGSVSYYVLVTFSPTQATATASFVFD